MLLLFLSLSTYFIDIRLVLFEIWRGGGGGVKLTPSQKKLLSKSPVLLGWNGSHLMLIFMLIFSQSFLGEFAMQFYL